jgi:serine/threonine protein kinase/WD40 repeat protein
VLQKHVVPNLDSNELPKKPFRREGFGGTRDREAPESTKAPPRSSDLLKDNDGWIDDKFRLTEKLGEGGFGLVYKAEQFKPIHRLVAVKILKAGMETQQVIARFDTERRSLALMEHPNIARVLDAGETVRGQPYVVMELVRGRSITSYARENKMTIQQRIELFIPVCHAVNHAHQKGIIHRDLKPSNVMVMEEDGLPTAKVIDFGIAKVLEHKNQGQTLATGMDQLIGTPGFISPEQILHGSSHVDTRSDVYALGSILLELLSGKPLVSAMDMAQKPMHHILRDQVELDPPQPSSREPLLKGDLDWIILKALEKEPDRRYGSADELADDLKRYLHDQPVRACPPSKRYLIGKFVRRHRVGVAAALAVSVAVLIGGITSTALYFVAEKNRIEAQRQRENVQKEFSRSDEQMARQFTERTDYREAVARLCRALRTDPENALAATNLLTLLEHKHLIQATTPELPLPAGAESARLVAVSKSAGKLLAISRPEASSQEVLSLWDMKSQSRSDYFLPSDAITTNILISKDGHHAYISMDDGQVQRWTLASAENTILQPIMPQVTEGKAQSVLCLVLSGDGRILSAGGDQGSLLTWNVSQEGSPAQHLRMTDASHQVLPINNLAMDYLGTELAAGSNPPPARDSERPALVKVWQVSSGQRVGEDIQIVGGIGALALHREREMLAIGLHSGEVHVLNYRRVDELLPDLKHPEAVISMNLNSDASILTVGDGYGYLHAWDLINGRPKFPAQAHDGGILLVRQPPGQDIVTSVSRNGELQLWNASTEERVSHRLQHPMTEAAVTDDASLLLVAQFQRPVVQAWNVYQRMTTRRFVSSLEQDPRPLASGNGRVPEASKNFDRSAWNTDCDHIIGTDSEGHIQVLRVKTGAVVGPGFSHPPAVGALALSEDAQLAVSSGRDQSVRLWDVPSGKGTGIVIRPGGFVSSLLLTKNKQKLITVTDEGQIRIWETGLGNCLTPSIHVGPAINGGPSIDGLHLSEDEKNIVFRVPKQGWFSLPMPPESPHLPSWFLDLAEALARRRLSSDGRTEALTLTDQKKAISNIPKQISEPEKLALQWTSWLLADPDQRPLSPMEEQSFPDYLESLEANTSPAAAAEISRYRRGEE